jgi:hypothetical protein
MAGRDITGKARGPSIETLGTPCFTMPQFDCVL